MKPLTSIPSSMLLERCAVLLDCPVDNIYLHRIEEWTMHGYFVDKTRFIGRRPFDITAGQYHDPKAKIPFPRPKPLPIDMVGGSTKAESRRPNWRPWLIGICIALGVLIGAIIIYFIGLGLGNLIYKIQ